MDHAEEQSMEVEMLQAMFTDDLKLVSAAPLAAFHIDLFPEASGADNGNHVAAELHVAYTPTYPEAAPTLRVVPKLGLSDALAAKVSDQLAAATAELLGAPMIWSLAELAQQFLREHNTPAALSAYDEMMLRQATGGEAGGGARSEPASDDDEYDDDEARAAKRAAEYVDERRVHATYTAVTPENFLKWRTAFLARTAPTTAEVELSSKLTGRQLFASGDMELAIEIAARAEGGDDDDDDVEDADYTRHSEEEGEEEGGEGAIDESLFDDED
jgi:hypothetical protein